MDYTRPTTYKVADCFDEIDINMPDICDDQSSINTSPGLQDFSLSPSQSGSSNTNVTTDSPSSDEPDEALSSPAMALLFKLNNAGMVIIYNWETRIKTRTKYLKYPEVTYYGHVFDKQEACKVTSFSIKDNQMPMQEGGRVNFNLFYDAVLIWHLNPKHKWNQVNSMLMESKPLWNTHHAFSKLLKHAAQETHPLGCLN